MGVQKIMEEKIIAMIAKLFNKNPGEISGSTLLKEELNAKSMNLLEISAMLENELGIDMPMDKIFKVKSVQDIIALVS